jgi:hypothetical protein
MIHAKAWFIASIGLVLGGLFLTAGDASNSYLVIKLEGRQTIGVKMPLGSSLDAVSLQNIKNWINKGANHN